MAETGWGIIFAHNGSSIREFRLGRAAWEEVAAQQFHAVSVRLRRLAAYYVWVETRVPRELGGQTTVSWTGDMETVQGEHPL